MKYLRVKWKHLLPEEPVLLYSELDENRREVRKVEIFADEHCGFASKDCQSEDTRLGEVPMPPLEEIAADPEFEPVEIQQKEFERIWQLALIRTAVTTTSEFPKFVTVRVDPVIAGLAIRICCEMRRKNNYFYLEFLSADGVTKVSGDQLLRAFDETRATFLMDYVDPRENFSGEVTAEVLSNSDLRGAVEAFEMFRGKVSFPVNYEQNLRAAASRGQNPAEYRVEIEVQ